MNPTPDNLTRLCRALYDREPESADYLGGSDAKMLGDAADTLERFRKALEEYADPYGEEESSPHYMIAYCHPGIIAKRALAGKEAGNDDDKI